jgi:hypothetical protein
LWREEQQRLLRCCWQEDKTWCGGTCAGGEGGRSGRGCGEGGDLSVPRTPPPDVKGKRSERLRQGREKLVGGWGEGGGELPAMPNITEFLHGGVGDAACDGRL